MCVLGEKFNWIGWGQVEMTLAKVNLKMFRIRLRVKPTCLIQGQAKNVLVKIKLKILWLRLTWMSYLKLSWRSPGWGWGEDVLTRVKLLWLLLKFSWKYYNQDWVEDPLSMVKFKLLYSRLSWNYFDWDWGKDILAKIKWKIL